MQFHRNFRPRAFPKKIGKGLEIKGKVLTTRLIKTANQEKKKVKFCKEPIRTQSKHTRRAKSAGKR